MIPKTIDDILKKLELIIENSIKTNSRAGYFAALYYKVTSRVKEGINSGEFANAARMEQFDVIFASRYLDAYQQWTDKKPVSASWKVAFETLENSSVLVLQQLFMGMNAHINLDLGIAVTEVAKANKLALEDLHADFNSINTILAALTYQVVNELDQISPLLSLAGLHSKNDSLFIQFAMDNARDGAWCFAEELFPKEGTDYDDCIKARDNNIASLGKAIFETKGLLRFTIFIIHLFEYKSPSKITKVLDEYKKTYIKVRH